MNTEQAFELERTEIMAMTELVKSAPQDVRDALGIIMNNVGGGVAFGRKHDTNPRYNRVFGLGINKPVSVDDIEQVKKIYESMKIRTFSISLCPFALPPDLYTLLIAAGFTHHSGIVKWVRDPSPSISIKTSLCIRQATSKDGLALGSALRQAFDDLLPLKDWVAAQIGWPGFQHYVALNGNEIVGGGTIFYCNGVAWFGMCGTIKKYRGCGAQSALIACRIDEARLLGCHTIMTETAPDTVERRSQSYRNVERAGFNVAYYRPNLVYNLIPQKREARNESLNQ